MKKRVLLLLVLILALLIVYANKYLELEYDANILEYIRFSSGYTKEEIEIIEHYKPLIYGGNINEPPLGIYYENNKQYTGLVVDFINALSIELETPIISQPMVWNQALEALMEGKTNLCDMVPSAARAKVFAFSSPIYKLRGVIVVKGSNKKVHELKDIKDMTVAVQKGDYAIELIPANENVNIIYADNISEAMNLLNINQVDAVIGDEPVVRYYINELFYFDDYRILEKPIYECNCAFAVPKEQEELLKVINKAIFGMKRKGIFYSIEAKWAGHHNSSLKENKNIEKLRLNIVVFIFFAVIILYLAYLWNRSLKLLVCARTKELNIMKNELEVIFDGIEDFLVVIGKDFNIKNINSSFIKYLKIEKDLIIDNLFMEIDILHNFEKEYDGLLYRLLSSQDKLDRFDSQEKYELKSKNQSFEIAIYPLERETSGNINILLMISDVTYTKLEEQKLIHSNKMATIGQLAAGVAHELRNPLGIIRNSTFILHREYKEKDELKMMALNAIDNSVNRASNIIENLLKFTRLTHDGREWINLKKIIIESTELNKKSLDEHRIVLSIYCENDMKIYMNNESLKHILMNLIQNAIDAMISNGILQICCFYDKDNVIIQIKDNGIGIEEEKVDKVFEPFYTTKPIGKGTGLGLYIAYSEVQKVNGEIKVESEKNKGTTFTISIPKGSEKI